MKEKLFSEIKIPEGVEAKIDESTLKVKGPEGENTRDFKVGKLDFKVSGKKIILSVEKGTKNDKRIMNTLAAHIQNMVEGVKNKFEYQVKICFGHFPFTVKQEGNVVIIKNFLGEKVNRKVLIPERVELEISKDKIIIKSVDKEIAGQTAANFEIATKIRGRDKRIFQDGIYIINKAGKEI